MTTIPLPPLREFVVVDQLAVHATVCTSLTDEQAVTRFNVERPHGHGWVWVLVNTGPCEDGKTTHRHLLLQQVRTTERTEA